MINSCSLSKTEIKIEKVHARDTSHKTHPKGEFGLESSRLQSIFPKPIHTTQEGQGKHKVLETDMSIWASYSKICQNFPFPLAAVYFPEALDALIPGSKTCIKKLHQQLHCV